MFLCCRNIWLPKYIAAQLLVVNEGVADTNSHDDDAASCTDEEDVIIKEALDLHDSLIDDSKTSAGGCVCGRDVV